MFNLNVWIAVQNLVFSCRIRNCHIIFTVLISVSIQFQLYCDVQHQLCRWILLFQSNMLPPSSLSNLHTCKPNFELSAYDLKKSTGYGIVID